MGGANTHLTLEDGPATEGGSVPTNGGGNLTWTQAEVTRPDRWSLMRQRGVVVWFTGLSGSGKSTLATGLDARLYKLGHACFVLDGDNLRHGLCKDLSFCPGDRTENIRRAGEVSCLMAEAGLIVICSLISPFTDDRDLVRESCIKRGIRFIEVYVNAPLNVCEKRDPKGLYQKARQGQIRGFTGIDSPYQPPTSPEVEVRTDQVNIEHGITAVLHHVQAACGLTSDPTP